MPDGMYCEADPEAPATFEPPEAPAPAGETKAERFKRLASARTQKVMNAIDILANCGSTATYEYTPEQVEKMLGYIERSIAGLKLAFGHGKPKDDTIEL